MKLEHQAGKREPASQATVWNFVLGKDSIGEAVWRGTEFLHKASLLIPAEFAETKTAAGRRRLWRMWQAQFTLADVLKIRPISDHGNVNEIIGKFGGAVQLRSAVNQLQSLLYVA
jgi:hypothetical protein